MRAVPVVVMQPVSQGEGSLSAVGVSHGIGPLPQAGLNEALCLAVGGHHPLHTSTELAVTIDRGSQERGNGLRVLVSGDVNGRC